MSNSDLAICIRVIDYSETSQIATFFGRQTGKIGAIAKGSKRPRSRFDGPIEILSCGDIVFSAKNDALAVLTEFQSRHANELAGLRKNLLSLNCAYFASELVDRLTDECDPHPALFDAFLAFLRGVSVARHRAGILALLVAFQVSLLKEIGLSPVLDACVNCRRGFAPPWPQAYFSSSECGLLCGDCEGSFPDRVAIGAEAAACLAGGRAPATADAEALNEAEQVLVSYLTGIMGRPPRMAGFVL
jgi:DNA repair protein RecO (recombination protein O)